MLWIELTTNEHSPQRPRPPNPHGFIYSALLRHGCFAQVLNSYGLGYRLTDNEDYLGRVLTGAESLLKFKWDVSSALPPVAVLDLVVLSFLPPVVCRAASAHTRKSRLGLVLHPRGMVPKTALPASVESGHILKVKSCLEYDTQKIKAGTSPR